MRKGLERFKKKFNLKYAISFFLLALTFLIIDYLAYGGFLLIPAGELMLDIFVPIFLFFFGGIAFAKDMCD